MMIQCRSRHHRSSQNIRRRLDPNRGGGILVKDGHDVSSATCRVTGSRPGATTGGGPTLENQQETTESRPESGEAIVVGVIGSAAPWFLTGWAHVSTFGSGRISGPMAGNMDRNPLEQAVPKEDQTSRPMEGAFGPEPLVHSVLKIHLEMS